MDRGGDRSSELRKVGQYTGLGLTFALAIGGLAYVGSRLDLRWGTEPWLTLSGALVGMAVGFVNLFRVTLPPKGRG